MIAETAQAVDWGKGFGIIFGVLFVFLAVIPAIEYGIVKLIDRIFDTYFSDDWGYGFSVASGIGLILVLSCIILITYKLGGGR